MRKTLRNTARGYQRFKSYSLKLQDSRDNNMNNLTESDLKRIGNLCLNHAEELSESGQHELATDYLKFGTAILEEKYRRFG